MRSRFVVLAALLAFAGCNHSNDATQCEQNANCDLSPGGQCLPASNGDHWCAYPDVNCGSDGLSWTQGAGDGLSGQCVPNNTRQLTVNANGCSVTSTPAGLMCTTGSCSAAFAEGTTVALSSAPTTGEFLGWSNDCSGSGNCSVTMDTNHVVTALCGAPGEALWSQQIGGPFLDQGTGIALDAAGDVIVIGSFQGSAMVGTSTLTSAGSDDFYVGKLSGSDGSVIWIKSFGGSGHDDANAVAVDSSNNIYVAGEFEGSANLGSGFVTSNGGVDSFVLKLDATGGYQWAKTFGGTLDDHALGVTVQSEVIAVVGTFQTSMTFDGVTITNSGPPQGYLIAFGTDESTGPGVVKAFSGTGFSYATSVVIDSASNIVVGGTFTKNIDFGGGTVTGNAGGDTFFAKYTGSGVYLIAKPFGGSGDADDGYVAVDSSDDIFLYGWYTGSVSFGGAQPINTNNGSVVIAKYSAAGAYDWAQGYGGTTAGIQATGAAVNAAGDIVLTGEFCGNLNLGTTMLASVGACGADNDIFAAHVSGVDGTVISATRAGGSSPDEGYRIAEAADGRHFLTGTFSGFADFGDDTRTSAGGYDAVVLALAPL